jgi:hypothetical protein
MPVIFSDFNDTWNFSKDFFPKCPNIKFIILRRIQGDNITNLSRYVKYRLFFSDFNDTWIFSKDFFPNAQILNLSF